LGERDLVSAVKREVHAQALKSNPDGCAPALQRLLFGGGKLKDNIGVGAYGIANGSTLTLIASHPAVRFTVQTEAGTMIPIEATKGTVLVGRGLAKLLLFEDAFHHMPALRA
jgi:hypothetical protein